MGNPHNIQSDRVFSETDSNVFIYNEVFKSMVDSVLKGVNGTIFAYGQTGSRKTFTMSGNDVEGVISQAISDIFCLIETIPVREYIIRISFIEIYNETVVIANKTVIDGLTQKVVFSPTEIMQHPLSTTW